MSTSNTVVDTPASIMSPIRSAPTIKVPVVNGTFSNRKELRNSIESYCHSIGKSCYLSGKKSGGYNIIYHCEGRRQLGCTFEIKAKRVDRYDTNNTTWIIMSANLDHDGCIYCLPSPRISTLLKDFELMTYAATAKNDNQIIQQARMFQNG